MGGVFFQYWIPLLVWNDSFLGCLWLSPAFSDSFHPRRNSIAGFGSSDRLVEEASCEEYDLVQLQFPSFRLEDKSNFEGGSNDTSLSKPWMIKPCVPYERRKKQVAVVN
ncbi:hypothetical protein V2J09_017029 [Rumex salicifolius]